MKIETVVVGPIEVNCYILSDDAGKAVVVDPGADAEAILERIESLGLEVVAYVLTHSHVDHVSGLADAAAKAPAPFAMHHLDLRWAFRPANSMPPYYPAPRRPATEERRLDDGQQCADAGLRYKVIHTPGHTPGCVCLYFSDDGILVTGDTLFAGSVGRTDLPGGDGKMLAKSLDLIAALPDATRILPGHGPETTLKREKKFNPFLSGLA